MYDNEERQLRAEKILAVLEHYLGDLSGLTLLDMSCSTGFMANVFSRHVKLVIGIDIDQKAVLFAGGNNKTSKAIFTVMNGLNTGFSDNSLDITICNQMYEHVPDAQKLFKEIYRILKPGGICYFGATNRLKIVETHYGRIPFLSYLPKMLAHIYLRILHRGDYYYENLHTYAGLSRLTSDFERIDYTALVIEDPVKFRAGEMVSPGSLRQKAALAALKWVYWFSPGYIWLLRKPGGHGVRD